MAVPAPATCSVAGLCVGMRLEAVDRKNRSMTCAANIVAVNANNDTIEINFDGWTDTYNYWCSPHDPDIHPIGWCRANHVAFHAPLGNFMCTLLELTVWTPSLATIINLSRCLLCRFQFSGFTSPCRNINNMFVVSHFVCVHSACYSSLQTSLSRLGRLTWMRTTILLCPGKPSV